MTISTKKICAASLATAAVLIGGAAHGTVAELADRGIWYSDLQSADRGIWYSDVESADRGIWYSSPRTIESADRGIWY